MCSGRRRSNRELVFLVASAVLVVDAAAALAGRPIGGHGERSSGEMVCLAGVASASWEGDNHRI